MRTTVVITLISLAAAFAVLFLHNWRLWEQNMPGQAMKGNKVISDSEEETDTEEMYQVSVALLSFPADTEGLNLSLSSLGD